MNDIFTARISSLERRALNILKELSQKIYQIIIFFYVLYIHTIFTLNIFTYDIFLYLCLFRRDQLYASYPYICIFSLPLCNAPYNFFQQPPFTSFLTYSFPDSPATFISSKPFQSILSRFILNLMSTLTFSFLQLQFLFSL